MKCETKTLHIKRERKNSILDHGCWQSECSFFFVALFCFRNSLTHWFCAFAAMNVTIKVWFGVANIQWKFWIIKNQMRKERDSLSYSTSEIVRDGESFLKTAQFSLNNLTILNYSNKFFKLTKLCVCKFVTMTYKPIVCSMLCRLCECVNYLTLLGGFCDDAKLTAMEREREREKKIIKKSRP